MWIGFHGCKDIMQCGEEYGRSSVEKKDILRKKMEEEGDYNLEESCENGNQRNISRRKKIYQKWNRRNDKKKNIKKMTITIRLWMKIRRSEKMKEDIQNRVEGGRNEYKIQK